MTHPLPRLARAALAASLAVSALATLATVAAAQAPAKHYKIGIIGSGNVGGTLGILWAKAGDDVVFASRHPEELKDLAAQAGPHAKTGTPGEAIAGADVVVIAVPYKVFPEMAKANAAAMKGKVVFDTSNAVAARDGAIVDEVRAKGIGAYSAALLPDTHLVRGFNAISYKNMASDGNKPDPIGIPLAGDDPKALDVGADLVRQAGFMPVVVPLKRADEFGPGLPLGVGSYTVADWKAKLGLKP